MSGRQTERILCFPRAVLDELGSFQGISREVDRYFPTIVAEPNCRYVVRADAEADPSFKQVIPYVLFVHEDTIFSYRRGKRGGEGRLHEQHSIGIGGHIEAEDRGLYTQDDHGYQASMWRELAEEVSVGAEDADACRNAPCVAVINDDTNDVGQVHFGVVHLVRLSSPSVSQKESAITASGFLPISEAISQIDRYETWSQLCLGVLGDLIESIGA